MKKMLIAAIATLALAACGKSEQSSDITLYYMPGCPHCHYAMDFFASELAHATLEKINVTEAGKNQERFLKALEKCGLSSRGVPLIIVQGECIQGYAPEVGAMIKEKLSKSAPADAVTEEVAPEIEEVVAEPVKEVKPAKKGGKK